MIYYIYFVYGNTYLTHELTPPVDVDAYVLLFMVILLDD
jgi:hypothetical protein